MEQRFCGKCGSQLDKKTGLCPICEADAIAKVQEKNSIASVKRAKRKGISIIIALILVIIAIVGGIILAFNKGWIGTPKGDTQQQVKTTYISYLSKVIVPKLGTYDANHPETSTEGVYSALFSDLNNDKKEEFIVAYAEKSGENINVKISCYEYNDNDKNKKSVSEEAKPEENVELIGTVTPSTEKDYTESSDEGFRLPNESILYSIEYEGTKYIIYEHLSWYEGFSYDAHVYTIKDGKFIEVSNIIIPLVGSDGTELIYSTKLPESISFDNSDFDFDKSESASYLKENYMDQGGIILYFHEGEDSTFEYNSHFDSVDAAIKAFFECYGIEKNKTVEWKDGTGEIILIRPDNVNYIYTYTYTFEYDDDTNTRKDKYEFNDYTNWQSLFEEEKTTEKNEDKDKPDVKSIINNTGKFTWNWFYDNTHTDKSKTIKRESEWGYEITYEMITEPNITSIADVKGLASNYYTDDVIDDLISMKQWVEEGGKLYVSETDGIGDNIVEKYVMALSKVDSQTYKLYVFEYLNNELLVEPYVVNMTKSNNNWILDTLFPFNEEVEITVIDESSTDYNKYMAYMAYKTKILNDYGSANDSYALYDIDHNGIKDLIAAPSKSDTFDFYTYSNELVSLGSVSSLYSGLLIPDEKTGLYRVCQRMDAEDLILVDIKNGKEFTQETIASGEQLSGKAEEYFRKYDAVEFKYTQYDGNSDTIDADLYKNLLEVLN